MKISRIRLYLYTSVTWLIFVLLSWFNSGRFELPNLIGFLALVFIPGLLTVLSLKLGQKLSFWYRLSLTIGFSLLEEIVWLLLCNYLLPHFHQARPLDRRPLLIELSTLYLGVVAASWRRLKGFRYDLKYWLFFDSDRDARVAMLPLLFVVLAIGGAFSLNNGGPNVLTVLMLIATSIYIGWLLLWRHRLTDNTYSWAIYSIGLSLLLMTSLRGWYTTGHDIQQEYEVFQLTKNAGVWSIAHLRNPFNACLSITILPTMLANTLHVADPYIYKVFFQLIFADVPVIVYLIMRRYLSKAKALLAVVYFIAFPTYFTDMPFLNRQEIAFLFLALMILIIHDKRLVSRMRTWLFILFGLGMIGSHYSTTYSWLFILLLALLLRPIYTRAVKRFSSHKLFAGANIKDINLKKPAISIPTVVILVLVCFVWNVILTGTAGALTSVVSSTISSITGSVKDDIRSSDVSYSLFAPVTQTPTKELASYVNTDVKQERASGPSSNFYPTAVIDKYSSAAVPIAATPIGWLGRLFGHIGINVSTFNYVLKQTSAKLLQIFVIIGLVYTLIRKKLSKPIESEFLLLTVASLIFVALQVILPYLSEAYGLLRAFQQALMLLGFFLVVGTFAITVWSKRKWIAYGIPTAIALIFFVSSTSVVSQLLGGYQPQLHLNNSGQYYNLYYTHKQEIAAIGWLNNLTANEPPQDVVLQADGFTFTRLQTYTKLRPASDIYPGMIMKNAYVFLGYYNVTESQSAIFYDGDTIAYSYPLQFLNQQKNLIYSNGGADIYK